MPVLVAWHLGSRTAKLTCMLKMRSIVDKIVCLHFIFASLCSPPPPPPPPHPHSPQLMYCLAHFSGDDRVPPYLMRLLDPSVVTETPALQHEEGFYYDFSPEDYQILCEKDPEYLFQDVSYRKHLKRHSNK